MASYLIKDTAKALVFVSGMAFDGSAFDDLELNDNEVREIIDEIDKLCKSNLEKLSKKYGRIPTTSTTDVVNYILFE